MYELNQREPDLATLIAIADYFSVSIDYLLGRNFYRHTTKEELQELIRMVIKEYREEYSLDPKDGDPAK